MHIQSRPSGIWRNDGTEFEFQRLHGMGEICTPGDARESSTPCRVYAPVGEHEDLLPYLVRRLLENGSNTSFVNRLVNENESVESIVADPVRTVVRTNTRCTRGSHSRRTSTSRSGYPLGCNSPTVQSCAACRSNGKGVAPWSGAARHLGPRVGGV
jgi:hypothetical protein